MRGQMLWFNAKKDHGFIKTDEGERLAVAGDGFAPGERLEAEGRCAQKPVTFEVETSSGSRRARGVVFVRDIPARRARMHGRGRG
jgi:cold shock CspA family protein